MTFSSSNVSPYQTTSSFTIEAEMQVQEAQLAFLPTVPWVRWPFHAECLLIPAIKHLQTMKCDTSVIHFDRWRLGVPYSGASAFFPCLTSQPGSFCEQQCCGSFWSSPEKRQASRRLVHYLQRGKRKKNLDCVSAGSEEQMSLPYTSHMKYIPKNRSRSRERSRTPQEDLQSQLTWAHGGVHRA